MIHNTDKFWNFASIILAAMIHVSVAAWAASGLVENNPISLQGKPRPLSMEINLTMIEKPTRPEPEAKEMAKTPDIPKIKPKPKSRKINKTRCYTEPPKPKTTQVVKVPEPELSKPRENVIDNHETPVPDDPSPRTVQVQEVKKIRPEDLARVSPVFPPGMTSPLRPRYPRSSRLKREEGDVSLRFHVRGDGRAEDIQIVKSSGYKRLDKAAARAVRTHEFIPAEQDHRPTDSLCALTIRFRIRT